MLVLHTDALGRKFLFTDKLEHATRSADYDVWTFRLQDALVLSNWYTTIEHFGLDVRQVSREPLKLVANLISKLARMAQHLCPCG